MRHAGAQDFREKYELLNRYCLARKAQLHSQDIGFLPLNSALTAATVKDLEL